MNTHVSKWLVRRGDRVQGPITKGQLVRAVETGQLRPADEIAEAGTTNWRIAKEVEWLFEPAVEPVTELEPEPVPSTEPKPPVDNTDKSLASAIKSTGVLIMLGFLLLAAVVGGFAMNYLRRTDDEALERHMAKLEDEEARKDEQKKQLELEEWQNQNFVSQLAKKIRSRTPPKETPLVKATRAYALRGIPNQWASKSTHVRDAGYRGTLTHGSPFMAGKQLVLIEDKGGLNFIMHHVDTQTGQARKVYDYTSDKRNDQYENVSWHKVNGKLMGQFVTYNFARDRLKKLYNGTAHFGWLDVETGTVKTRKVSKRTMRTRERMLEMLMEPQYPKDTEVSLTNGQSAINEANRAMKPIGLAFDPNARAINLRAGLREEWDQKISSLNINSRSASDELYEVVRSVEAAPDCELSKTLKPAIRLAQLANENDGEGVRRWLQANSGHYLRNHAAATRLQFISTSDKVKDYVDFQNESPATPARDLAILRVHEIAWTKAVEEAQIEVFDRFMESFPAALKWKDAFQYAYDLELERANFAIEHAGDADAKREQVANSFYVQWRDARRDGRYPAAERMWKLLADEPQFQETKAAARAQDSKDRDRYRRKILQLSAERNRILGDINRSLGSINSTLGSIEGQMRENNSILRDINTSLETGNGHLDRIAYNTSEKGFFD